MDNKILTPIAIIIAGGLIAWGVMADRDPSQDKPKDNGEVPAVAQILEDDYILGDPNADVVIIEYSDIECPYCKNFHNTTKRLMEDYGADGKLALIFRHFPLDQLHNNARKEAIAVECAGELGGSEAFWAYLNAIFEATKSNDGLDLSQIPVIAKNVGLDGNAFASCLEDKSVADKVQADFQSGVDAGVRGTPHSFMLTKDGEVEVINGAQPYDMLKTLIDVALIE